ncbi:substrate-binding domain-containing protein [Christensenella tenuis]|uniref:Substrate-binding domain-containing protein n=1 Tax=Christensenella tenuis TaxID=2763033 RepID=A0ABR7EDS6_9FIRM|nr:substrate-binding domain-containing protein [Christensenella tenuis]MBC5647942.1 substrate-binding domain-containing protein [Christensenella tenuis]
MKKTMYLVTALLLVAVLVIGCAAPSGTASTAPEDSAAASSGTSAGGEDSGASGADDAVKIAYVSKQLTNQWFVLEDNGFKDKAAELGIEYIGLDANLDDEACDAAIDNALAQGIDGLALTITNQGNGPSVVEKCREKGIPIVTLDDPIEDMDGNPVPHVGMPTVEVGIAGGEVLAQYANERGWFDDPNNVVAVMQIDAPDITPLRPRLDGYQQALMENTPLTEEDFIYVETSECMLEDSLPVAQATVQAHPEVTHWIVGGVNDDSAIAALKAFEEAGITKDNYLICGLGGYEMAVEEFEKGNDSFMTVVLDPYGEAQVAMEMLYENIVNGTELPLETFVNGKVATLDNWTELIEQ